MIRLPRAVEERAMHIVHSSEGSALRPADALVVGRYRSKQHWVVFNDDLLHDTPQWMDLFNHSEAWSMVNKLFRKLTKDGQCALQIVLIDGKCLRKRAQLLGVLAMTAQRRVKRGLSTIAKKLNAAYLEA